MTAVSRHGAAGHRGFTLLELLVAVSMMLLLLIIAVPSFSGYYADRALTEKLDAFNALVLRARAQSMASGEPAYLVWSRTGVSLEPRLLNEDGTEPEDDDTAAEEDAEGPVFFPMDRDSRVELELPYSLMGAAPDRWTFWPSGNCEPAVVSYKGPEGKWTLAINPMSADYRVTNYELGSL